MKVHNPYINEFIMLKYYFKYNFIKYLKTLAKIMCLISQIIQVLVKLKKHILWKIVLILN